MFGIKGQCLGLISSVSISVQRKEKQIPFQNYNGGFIISRKLTISFVPQMQRFAITLYTLHTRVRVLWVMGIEQIGGRRTEAEAKSHINCLELMAVIFSLKAFCSRKSASPCLYIFEEYNNC